MNSQQTDGTIILGAEVRQELDPQISCPDEWLLDQKCLYTPRTPCLESTEHFPSVQFDWIAITDADSEGAEDGAEEFIICQNERVD